MTAPDDDSVAAALIDAVRAGDVNALGRLLTEHPKMVSLRVQGRRRGSRSLLHFATDWPGYFPNGPEIVQLLIDAGADPNVTGIEGEPSETPLHWAASSDDVDVAAVLIDAGADIEAQGGSIAQGSPLDNAVGYGCWHVARLLVARGARVDELWHAAALGLLPRLEELLQASPPPSAEDIDEAFYQACAGGQRRTAECLLRHGADVNASPEYANKATPIEMAGSPDTRRQTLVTWLGEHGAKPTHESP